MSDSHDNPYAAPQAELSPSPIPMATSVPERNIRRPMIHDPLLFWPIWTLLYLANCILPFMLGLDVVQRSNGGIAAMLLGIITFYLAPSYINYRNIEFRRYWLSGALIVGLSQFFPAAHIFSGLLALSFCLANESSCSPIQAYFTTIITGAELCFLALIVGRIVTAIYDAFVIAIEK
jgi:hypothetical protein